MVWLVLALSGSTLATSAPVPARWIMPDMRLMSVPVKGAPYDYRNVYAEHTNAIALKGPPSNTAYISICKGLVKAQLKSPGTARWIDAQKTVTYNQTTALYDLGGQVDSQNDYGALKRTSYFCTGYYTGTNKKGTLYLMLDVL